MIISLLHAPRNSTIDVFHIDFSLLRYVRNIA